MIGGNYDQFYFPGRVFECMVSLRKLLREREKKQDDNQIFSCGRNYSQEDNKRIYSTLFYFFHKFRTCYILRYLSFQFSSYFSNYYDVIYLVTKTKQFTLWNTHSYILSKEVCWNDMVYLYLQSSSNRISFLLLCQLHTVLYFPFSSFLI